MKEAKYLIVLTGVAVVCAALLAYVYKVTAGPIEMSKNAAINEGIQAVAPEFDNDPVSMMYLIDGQDPLSPVIYPATRGGVVVGAAVKTVSKKGYAGNVVVMVGLEGAPDGQLRVLSTTVVDMKETPGLGTKAKEPGFAGQFQQLSVPPDGALFKVKKDGGSINAIAGATITSRAFTECVNVAVKAWREHGAAALKAAADPANAEPVNSGADAVKGGANG
ncbi:MAG TPA: RnfABCDGE type electron transport complex subunit G [Myxococcota bacterium]|nr:RnfABCDGE type electron transport complex subunit G [Myxococcota bacterium]